MYKHRCIFPMYAYYSYYLLSSDYIPGTGRGLNEALQFTQVSNEVFQ